MRIFKSVLKLTLIMVFVAGLALSIHKIMYSNLFNVKKVEIIGTQNANKAKLKKYFSKFLGKNIFEIKSVNLPDDVWVKKFEIIKEYPSKVIVKVFEKKPLFKYKFRGRCFYKLSDGSAIRTSCENVNVFLLADVDDGFLREFAGIYEKIGNAGKFYLKTAHFEIKNEKGVIYGFYDSEHFMRNFKYYEGIKDKFYKDVKYANLMVDGKIYISGVKREIR